MLFLASLLDQPVHGKTGEMLGRLEDVIVYISGEPYPPISGLVVRDRRRLFFVSANQLESFNGIAKLSTSMKRGKLAASESCSSFIESELSMTKRMSICRLTLTGMFCRYSIAGLGSSLEISRVGHPAASIPNALTPSNESFRLMA